MDPKRVLLIDEDMAVRRDLTKGLSAHGYEVRSCRDGVSAIHELEHSHNVANHFDYIITDAQLQDIAGTKLMKVLKTAWPDLPMVVIAEPGDAAASSEVKHYGNATCVHKPVEIDGLLAAMTALLPVQTTEEHKHLAPEAAPRVVNAKAYLSLKIVEADKAEQGIAGLGKLQGVTAVHRVQGDMDVIVKCWRRTKEELEQLVAAARTTAGLEVTKVNYVVPAKLDADVAHFIEDYNYALEKTVEDDHPPHGPYAYLLVDIDPAEVQAIFTRVYFIDQVLECDVSGGGNRIIAYACEADKPGYAKAVKWLAEVPGVLRIRESAVAD